MKKSLLFLLLAVLGLNVHAQSPIASASEIEAGKAYTMKTGKGYIGTTFDSANKLQVVSDAAQAGKFMFVASTKVDDAFYIYSVDQGKFFTTKAVDTPPFADEVDGYFTVTAYNNASYPNAQRIKSSTTGYNMLVTNAPFTVILSSGWNYLDNGGDWNITEVEDCVLPEEAQAAAAAYDATLKRTISSPDQLLGNMAYTMKTGKGYIGTNINEAHKLEVVTDAALAGKFAFIASETIEGAHYIYSVEHKKFFTTQPVETDVYVDEIDGYFTISAYNNANYPNAQRIRSNTTGKNMLVTNAPFTVTLESAWNSLDNGGDWNITEAEEFELPAEAKKAVVTYEATIAAMADLERLEALQADLTQFIAGKEVYILADVRQAIETILGDAWVTAIEGALEDAIENNAAYVSPDFWNTLETQIAWVKEQINGVQDGTIALFENENVYVGFDEALDEQEAMNLAGGKNATKVTVYSNRVVISNFLGVEGCELVCNYWYDEDLDEYAVSTIAIEGDEEAHAALAALDEDDNFGIGAGSAITIGEQELTYMGGKLDPTLDGYITVTFAEGYVKYVWGDYNATGINAANAANGEAVYNLNGQRVSKLQNGLYIVGGKKVVK